MRPSSLVALAVLVLALPGCVAPPAASVEGARDLVAASHPAAAAAGLEILAAGGNAVDAAAAVQFALNVVEPMMSGIGGGAFILIHAPDGALVALDGRETAPAAATPDMLQRESVTGVPIGERGTAVAVPGALAVWDRALREHGTMTLAQVLAPAIRLAEEGVTLDPIGAGYLTLGAEKLRRSPDAASVFLQGATCPPAGGTSVAGEAIIVACQGGAPLVAGDRLVQPKLAATLRLLADEGPAAFYEGPLGDAIVEAAAARGGVLAKDDLRVYATHEREVLVRPWRGLTVATVGLPASGVVVQETLAILEPWAVAPRADPDAAHAAIEALHLAFADRAAYFSDPTTARAAPADVLEPAFIDARRALMDPARAGAPFPAGALVGRAAPQVHDRSAGGAHTTHFNVMDRDGRVVAATSTLESLFGSGIMVPDRGFFLNNQMMDFDLAPGGPNEVGPGKRPLSSMTPTLVLDARGPVLALGSPGGKTIPGSVVQVLLDVLVGGTRVEEAVEAPRWASVLDATVSHERDLDRELLEALAARGHRLEQVGPIGATQAIHRDPERGYVAVADPRRAGEFGTA